MSDGPAAAKNQNPSPDTETRYLTQPSCRIKPCDKVLFFPFIDGGVLFRPGTRRLWCLNLTSAVIWCLLDSAVSLEHLTKTYRKRFAVSENTARLDVSRTVGSFLQAGLLAGGKITEPPGGTSLQPDRKPASLDGACSGHPAPLNGSVSIKNRASINAPAHRKTYRIGRHVIELVMEAPSSSDAQFLSAFVHLEVPESSDTPHTRIRIEPPGLSDNRRDIHVNGIRQFCRVPSDTLPNCLVPVFFQCATGSLKHKLLFHAAVVGNSRQVLMLPAGSAAGKTTLTALLLRRGYDFYSDELAVVDIKDRTVTPFPMPMSIKPGSLDIMASGYPELKRAFFYRRPDGRQTAYVPPPKQTRLPSDARAVIRAFIFPTFRKHNPTRLARISKPDALNRLFMTVSSNRDLKAPDISTILHLIERTPCFRLPFSDANKAADIIDSRFHGDTL